MTGPQIKNTDNPITLLRIAAGLTHAQAAARCGWNTISAWTDFENNRVKSPRITRYLTAAAVLDCSIYDLLGIDDPPKNMLKKILNRHVH